MELKISNDELIEIYQGCRELLTIEDLETLFSFRVSSIVEKMTPMIKAYTTTRETLDKKYLTIEVEKDGEVIGKRTEPHVASEYVDKVSKSTRNKFQRMITDHKDNIYSIRASK